MYSSVPWFQQISSIHIFTYFHEAQKPYLYYKWDAPKRTAHTHTLTTQVERKKEKFDFSLVFFLKHLFVLIIELLDYDGNKGVEE